MAQAIEPPPPEALTEPPEAARAAGLRYTSDAIRGITRRRAGSGFTYLGPDGERISDSETLVRIRALAIPPAWTDVWISPYSNGHLQATGRDARGRKQYRYHARWRAVRDETKYHRTIAFARALPGIRRRLKRDLAEPGLPRDKVLAVVVHLLDESHIRVGNPEYARDNRSYGLTTLQNRHVKVTGSEIRFSFPGKGGKRFEIALQDPRVARVVRKCRDLPGQDLFQYVDDGEVADVGSEDVNAYLLRISGEEFTSKDFRTWSGTVLAADALDRVGRFRSQREARSKVLRAIEEVSEELGNTPSVCRKCYVHPDVVEAYLDGTLHDYMDPAGARAAVKPVRGLRIEEARVLALLRDRSRAARRSAA
jgi:DNA topoisomerase I